MKFKKGNKLAKGGRREGSGRRSNQVIADEARATEIAREMLARGLGSVIETAKKLCKGIRRKKWFPRDYYEELKAKDPKARRFYYETEYDSRMIQFWLERFIPAARQAIDVNVDSPEKFWQALEAAERLERERQQPAIEPGESKTKGELSYDQRQKTNP
jgi:hypothetical protein